MNRYLTFAAVLFILGLGMPADAESGRARSVLSFLRQEKESQVVFVDTDRLLEAIRAEHPEDRRVIMDVGMGDRHWGHIREVRYETPSRFVVRGEFPETSGWFTIVVSGEQWRGVVAPRATTMLRLRPRNMDHFLEPLLPPTGTQPCPCCDELRPPLPADPIPDGLAAPAAVPAESPEVAGNTVTLDLLIVYTAEARQSAGGTDAIRDQALLAVELTNDAYSRSGVNARVRLVHTAEVSYSETGNMNTDLNRLTGTSDGFMDNVHALRNQYGADFVTLFTNRGGSLCGLAWVLCDYGQAPVDWQATYAFSVVARDCADSYTLAHELGHNLGLQHNPGDSCQHSYSHGYLFQGNSGQTHRTIMAGWGTPLFSTPNVLWDGVPAGVPAGSPNDADAARTLNFTIPIAVTFRSTTTSTTPAITSPSTGQATIDSPYSYQITATNNPTSFGASGLPAGLKVNTSTGLISGSPSQSGTFNIGLSATNANGTGTSTLKLTVDSCALGRMARSALEAEGLDVMNLFQVTHVYRTLRTVRDRLQGASPEFRPLIDAYYEHTPDFTRILASDRILAQATWRYLERLSVELGANAQPLSESSTAIVLSDRLYRDGRELISRFRSRAEGELRDRLDELDALLTRTLLSDGQGQMRLPLGFIPVSVVD